MKNILRTTLAISIVLCLISCNAMKNANKTQKGAGIGVASGAIAGGIIGGNLKGALIGAAIGGVSGAIIGNVMDKQARKIEEAIPGAEVERVGEGIHVVFDENSGVNFATNKSDLTSKSEENLDKVAKILIEFPDTNITIQGHTDNTGKNDYNLSLSRKRAESVAEYLSSNGVSFSRFRIEALGEDAPRYDNNTVEGRAQNRRVEMAISANQEMIEDAQAKQRN
ncbi:OmpA family protein [Xanthomarina sp. F1114]|uniref:OmpA family protein n=1 Tax=Xanthomarina sp. F1114 TaxID=2996019 RepID=UPI00225E50E8|nr:OmpA family protein [Xanthomarina sp. F1114]MCX7546339.1 OmpA family protein [Xanthomarina sp. F1114]